MNSFFPDHFAETVIGPIQPFDVFDGFVVPASQTQTVLTFTAQQGYFKGWITAYGQGCEDETKFTEKLQWLWFKNGDFIPMVTEANPPNPYVYSVRRGRVDDPSIIEPFKITQNDVFRIDVFNNFASALFVSARILGFFDLGSKDT